ncbi:SGK1 isoform 28, partial [Pongo abelii]
PPGEPDFEPSLCQTCLGEHAFQREVLPQENESCSWETQSGCEILCKTSGQLTSP